MSFEETVIFDNGTSTLKVGSSYFDTPYMNIPICDGSWKYRLSTPFQYSGEFSYSYQPKHLYGTVSMKYPVNRGRIYDFNSMQEIWERCYSKELRLDYDQHPVLITESGNSTKKDKENLSEIFFESFYVPSFFCSYQPVLSLYSTGKVTGLVVECGDGLTQIMPVYQNFSLNQAKRIIRLGGQDISKKMKEMLKDRGCSFNPGPEMSIIEDLKKRLTLDINWDEENFYSKDELDYELPDGEVIKISNSELNECAEYLFKPYFQAGIVSEIMDSLQRVDDDLIKDLLREVILTGGVSQIYNFSEKLRYEVQQRVCWNQRVIVRKDRYLSNYSAWLGGKILSSLCTFENQSVSNDEYDEFGASIVYRKCF